ncbi:MAG: TetR/AcrR family transcriptional regulator [Alphaproteobacteria bacterium]|nr:TetR/AcrR family transcriptional regulator [Alphaproteobacteria bacterium]
MSSGNPETRERILNSAWKLLEATQGREVRMTDIAKEAGVSRQALYLHFPTRSDLLVATTRHIEEVKNVDARLARSRSAETGTERLNAFIDAWGNFIPEIYGVAKALMAMSETDDAAKLAWDGRMQAVRHGCRAAIDALERDGQLSSEYSAALATDILWTLLSVRAWEHLTIDCGWSQQLYIEKTKVLALQILVNGNTNG